MKFEKTPRVSSINYMKKSNLGSNVESRVNAQSAEGNAKSTHWNQGDELMKAHVKSKLRTATLRLLALVSLAAVCGAFYGLPTAKALRAFRPAGK